MQVDGTRVAVTPSRPVLFASVGDQASRAVAELPAAAADQRIRVSGPIGFVRIDLPAAGSAGRVTLSNVAWLPPAGRLTEKPDDEREVPLEDTNALALELKSLARRLRVPPCRPIRGTSPRVRVSAYVVLDLSAPDVIDVVLRVAEFLRAADPNVDVTGLALTCCTAETHAGGDEVWVDAWELLVDRLQETNWMQRLYLLDGRDPNGTWLQTMTDMHRLAASFLLQHGLSAHRDRLRRRECEWLLTEDFHMACGAFGCRTLISDPAAVEEAVARVVADDLPTPRDGVLPEEQADELDRKADALANRLAGFFQSGPLMATEASSTTDAQVLDTVRGAIEDACTAPPVLRLRWFLSRLMPRLDQLAASSRLADRIHTRYRAAETLRGQQTATYGPVRQWLKLPGASWKGPYDPVPPPPPAPPPPSGMPWLVRVGIGLIGLGVLVVLLGLGMGGGLVALVAGAALVTVGVVLLMLGRSRPSPPLETALPARPKLPALDRTREDRPSEMGRWIDRLRRWCEALLAQPAAPPKPAAQGPPPQPVGSILEILAPDWAGRIADVFRRERGVEALLAAPEVWARYLVAALEQPDLEPREAVHQFVLQAVREWLTPARRENLMGDLEPSLASFDWFLNHCLAPRWPSPREEPAVDVSVIAVANDLWCLLEPLARADTLANQHLVRAEWLAPGTLVACRIVQGLKKGWRDIPPAP